MPSRRRRQVELERVLGTPALFATAYGNVGSSIYYALGVTAVFALGLTPLVFVVAGRDLRLHRGHLRRGDGALSRGRRLVELRPARLQRARLVRRCLGADARLHRHGRHLGVLRPALPLDLLGAAARTNPWDIVGGIGRDRRARRPQHRRGPGGGEAVDHRSRWSTSRRRCCSSSLGFVLVFNPGRLVDNVHWGVAPTWSNFALAIPVGDDRVHGGRDRLQPRRGGARPRTQRARAYKLVALAVFAIYFTLPLVALSALPVKRSTGS